MKLDLHIHSVYSDGTLTPEQIVDAAYELGLSAISITDHDNVGSFELAKKHADLLESQTGKQMEIIPGIEVNTIWEGQEIHILGYHMNLNAKPLAELIKYQQHARLEQTYKIIEKLNKEAKMPIKIEDVTSLVMEGGSIGRPHIAKSIVNVGGTKSVLEAYSKYINDKSPTYVRRITVSPHEAVETIYESGGIPVIAHPCDLENVESLVKDLMNFGLRGIEVYHRKHSPAMVEYYSTLTEEYGLIVTGGSDCHGPKANKQLFLGKNFIPEWVISGLREEKNRLEIAAK
ncbi:MAG: PHP domain-containing protein [bacterium]